MPYRVSFARYPNGRLQKDIFNCLEKSYRLERLEEAFHPANVASVRAALIELLATGKIISPDLDSKPLGLTKMFRRPAK